MKRVSTSEVRGDLAEIINRVCYNGERIVVNRRGKDVAAMVPVDELAILEELEDHLDLEEARAALRDAKRKGTIPWEKIKASLGL